MNSWKKTWAVLVAATALAAAPLVVASADPVTYEVPAPAATHGGWICVTLVVHVCFP